MQVRVLLQRFEIGQGGNWATETLGTHSLSFDWRLPVRIKVSAEASRSTLSPIIKPVGTLSTLLNKVPNMREILPYTCQEALSDDDLIAGTSGGGKL